MLDNVLVFCQSSIKINSKKTIYFDPYLIDKDYNDADIIFITHEHYDHFDLESINRVKNENTIIVVPNSMIEKTTILFEHNEILGVNPNEEYNVYDISFKTKRAYNINKKFHPKENNWVGYIIYIDNHSYYIMGDTDDNPDIKDIKCDVLFIPIGGTYTMNSEEASRYTNSIKPQYVIPIHYKTVVGSDNDYYNFIDKLDKEIKYKKYI